MMDAEIFFSKKHEKNQKSRKKCLTKHCNRANMCKLSRKGRGFF